MIPAGDVFVPDGRRQPTDEQIQARARSMNEIGLLNPILLNDEQRLIAGRTRLEAAKLLGWKTIPYRTLHFDDLHARLAEIDENIERSNLTALEEGQAMKERKDIYLALHPETRNVTERGGPGRSQTPHSAKTPEKQGSKTNDKMSFVLSFSEDTAQKTGNSQRTVQRDVEVAEKLTPATQTQIAGTPVADSKSQLKALADLPAKQQEEVAGLIGAGKAKTVAKAMEIAKVTKPPKKTLTGPEEEAAKAKAQIKIWADTISRWLGQSPSIDEYRTRWPGKRGDNVVQHASTLYEALKLWQKEIK
ncbi:MAG: ParB N-terminal domain-containing protein [Planctomycetia bacterium]|nr:ParB N-terminal domain-containing protein [Planctomycetia bacterium]